mmetsp:Transcript_16423/g.33487  ORF Transcript_16423/g.33487 Transcript_16423/m.33487 type:complete len:136 (-) Transcript_16423:2287-2694(-)
MEVEGNEEREHSGMTSMTRGFFSMECRNCGRWLTGCREVNGFCSQECWWTVELGGAPARNSDAVWTIGDASPSARHGTVENQLTRKREDWDADMWLERVAVQSGDHAMFAFHQRMSQSFTSRNILINVSPTSQRL